MKLPSDSSASNTHQSLFPSFAEFLIALRTPPFMIVGSSLVLENIAANNDVLKRIKLKNYYTYGVDPKSQFHIKNIKQVKKFSQYDLAIKLPGKKDKNKKFLYIWGKFKVTISNKKY